MSATRQDDLGADVERFPARLAGAASQAEEGDRPACFGDYDPRDHPCDSCPVRTPCQTRNLGVLRDRHEDEPEPEAPDPGVGYRWKYIRAILGCDLHANARLVAVAIATYADGDGGECWPSAGALAGMVGRRGSTGAAGTLSTQAVHRWVRRLHDAGWLDVVPFLRPNGQQSTSLYLLRIPGGSRGAERWARRGERGFHPAPGGHQAWERAPCHPDTRRRVLQRDRRVREEGWS